MDYEKTITYIENSFLSSLLKQENITDISYNGKAIFYLDNNLGRKKSDIKPGTNEVKDFIRQLSFLTEKQFSYQSPFLDVSIGRYRLNAVHQSVGRIGNQEALTFSIRLASLTPQITEESGFLTPELKSLFKVLLESKLSLAIGGVTGSGKTEFQKYLLRSLKPNTRVIIIDNLLELESVRETSEADINTWLYDDRNGGVAIQTLVRNALRSNPDWLIVAESRGAEMQELLNSMMTGHPIITTLHALDVEGMPYRMSHMVMMNEGRMNYEDVKSDLLYHLRFFVYLKHDIDSKGKSHRYISEINYLDEQGNKAKIYRYKKGRIKYQKLPKTATKILKFDESDELFIKTFIDQEEEKE